MTSSKVVDYKIDMKEKLMRIFERLLDFYGKQHWWPAQTKDEVVIGAILTQNTGWKNVARAIENLKQENLCSLKGLYKSSKEQIQKAIKPAGFFRQKGGYLKNVAEFFEKNGGFEVLQTFPTDKLRNKLLSIKGVGKETADSILLYAFQRPIFVVDSYTKRFTQRHRLYDKLDYDNLQSFFMDNLDKDVELFNEYHALIVKNAKEFCRTKPLCDTCPLKEFL